MERSVPLHIVAFVAACTAGCSSSSSHNDPAVAQALDPAQQHYGQSHDQWGAQWWKWVYELPEPGECVIPFQDPTGEHCTYGQTGDVFFLAGTSAGVAVRDQCKVPLSKAILFPILSFSADNGGVPADMALDDMALSGVVQNQLDKVPIAELAADFDGVAIPDLGRFKTPVTKFSYTLPPEPNVYTCGGAMGVTGAIDPSYEGGFYVMLAPPTAGAHTLHFAGHSPASSPDLKIDVTYHLTVQ